MSRYWTSASGSSVAARWRVPMQHLDCAIALQLAPGTTRSRAGARIGIAHDGDAVEIAVDRVAGQCFQRGLGAKYPGRPVRLRVEAAEHAEDAAPAATAASRAHALFVTCQR